MKTEYQIHARIAVVAIFFILTILSVMAGCHHFQIHRDNVELQLTNKFEDYLELLWNPENTYSDSVMPVRHRFVDYFIDHQESLSEKRFHYWSNELLSADSLMIIVRKEMK